jgi:hypothetical protein
MALAWFVCCVLGPAAALPLADIDPVFAAHARRLAGRPHAVVPPAVEKNCNFRFPSAIDTVPWHRQWKQKLGRDTEACIVTASSQRLS